MAILKCKMCGGDMEISADKTVAMCDYCGSTMTIPKIDDDQRAAAFNRGNHFRRSGEFDKALAVYERIVADNDADAEAHWCCALCRFGIDYVEDPATMEYLPTCHRASFDSFLEDVDYLAAVEHSDGITKRQYMKDGAKIAEVQRGILATSQNAEPYDVFISYKELDANGERTRDSILAQDIYYQLTEQGRRVFFSRITLEDVPGTQYEPYIFAALNSAKVMIVVGTSAENLNAVWVKNEWSRYLSMMRKDRSKLLLPCYRDMDPYDLPEQLSVLMSYDMGKIGFIQDLIRGVNKVLDATAPKAETVKETVVVQNDGGANYAALLKRAFMFLEDGNWQDANAYCEKVLDNDPECAQAYLGKLMAELHVKKREELDDCEKPFDTNSNYQKILRFDNGRLAAEVKGYANHINERNENARLTGIYDNAQCIMHNAQSEEKYKEAAKIFKSISGFMDADAVAEKCLDKAEKLKRERLDKEEADRLEAERKAEERRIAAEKAAKKRKKIIAITAPIIVACIAFIIVLNTVIIPNNNYKAAVALMGSGKYEEAIAAFEEMGGYKDSASMITESKYELSLVLIDSGDIVGAYESLVALNGYKDSAAKASEIYNQYKLKTAAVGDTVLFGAYEQDNNTSNGKEGIEWRVLAKEGGKLLIISEYALDCQQYNTSSTNVTWETCSLRKWMNGTFLNAAFSTEEQAQIQSTNVSADKNPEYRANPGNATTDKVFLLSITEVEKYFTSDSARQCKPTKYAVANGAYVNSDNGNCWWWLRSPGCDQKCAAYVHGFGSVRYSGNTVSSGNDCVRPALWIILDS